MVLSQNEIKEKLDRYLLKVQKPGRYTGGELNQVVKEWESVNTHVALVFPDIYDLGISNLGLAILYETLNQRDDVLAERAYCPWDDMEALMREEDIPELKRLSYIKDSETSYRLSLANPKPGSMNIIISPDVPFYAT